ncbi:helix-turn-helix domain-containing protein [Fodinisporobacter ferrooxydans]|uniref:Helix-turn-helix domain-containing protein n=1 Tax=Fodinisporobacter ferrooxydans TaxID=2901836 RepID=A0ABY4CH70_9BACL|nr:helix-turn-helix domain-containing protein [Alicyclobacillaceae bacterium MYW30-H2]
MQKNPGKNLGYKLKILRIKNNWTQKELSKRCGISTPHISSIERGKRNPSLQYAARLSQALDVPIQYFCDVENNMVFYPTGSLPHIHTFSPSIQRLLLNESNTPYLALAQRISEIGESAIPIVYALVDALHTSHTN